MTVIDHPAAETTPPPSSALAPTSEDGLAPSTHAQATGSAQTAPPQEPVVHAQGGDGVHGVHGSHGASRDFWGEYVYSFTYLFEDKKWLAKTWVLPFFLWVPVVNLFGWWLLKAWQVSAVQSLARGRGLPALNGADIMGNFFKRLVIAFTNFLVPIAFFWATGLSGPLDWWEDFQQLIKLEWWEFLKGLFVELVTVFIISYIWMAISSCIVQSGIIRWTLTGKWTAALNPLGNLYFFLTHLHHFAKFYVYYLMSLFVVWWLSIFLMFTVVGVLLIPIITCWYYLSVSHELGHLAHKVAARKGIALH